MDQYNNNGKYQLYRTLQNVGNIQITCTWVQHKKIQGKYHLQQRRQTI